MVRIGRELAVIRRRLAVAEKGTAQLLAWLTKGSLAAILGSVNVFPNLYRSSCPNCRRHIISSLPMYLSPIPAASVLHTFTHNSWFTLSSGTNQISQMPLKWFNYFFMQLGEMSAGFPPLPGLSKPTKLEEAITALSTCLLLSDNP